MTESVETEVRRCHVAFQDWIAGRADQASGYERELVGRLDPNGVYVTVSGKLRTLGALLEDLRSAGGANPEFEITTGAVRVIDSTGSRWVVLYEERTRGARQSRSSSHTHWVTAVLRADEAAPGGFRWMHVHEVQVRPESEL